MVYNLPIKEGGGAMKRRFLCLIAILLSLLSLGGCVSFKSGSIGCWAVPMRTPISEYYEDSPTARNPWNMKLYDGILYFATGDYGANSGKTPIFAYDTVNGCWLEPFLTSDEALESIREIGNTLIAVGNDSTESGIEGNYYELDGGRWTAHTDIPDAMHVFDVAEYDGARFFAIGTDDAEHFPVLKQTADGNFVGISFLKSGENRVSGEDFEFLRAYNLFIADGELYTFFFAPHLDKSKPHVYEFYKYDGEAFRFVSDFGELPISFLGINDGEKNRLLRQNFFTYEFSVGEYAYFTSGLLYKTRDFENIEQIEIPSGGAVSDLVCRDGQYFVLSFSRNTDGGFTNTVWELKADDEFSKMVSFKTDDAYGLSFEFDGERFYVALGNRSSTDGVGSLCIIDVS